MPLRCLQQSHLDGPDIVRRMLELLSQEQEAVCDEWANCIVSDLAEAAGDLWKTPANKSVLLFALQMPVAAPHIAERLEVRSILPFRSGDGLQFFAEVALGQYWRGQSEGL